MNSDNETSIKEEKVLSEVLAKSGVEPPELITQRIRKAAFERLESNKKHEVKNKQKNSLWYKLLPIAACVVFSFYAGTKFQDVTLLNQNGSSLVFQGSNNKKSNEKTQEWSEDELLKAIAESALAGNISRAEMLIAIYKESFTKDNQ